MKVQKLHVMEICKHCLQRLGEDHRLDCPFVKSGSVQAADAPPPTHPGGGPVPPPPVGN